MHGIFCSLNLIDLTSYERQKMINNSRENDFQAKKEGNSADERKLTKGSSSSRPWSGLKDPRVVRVSRSFGGKDRHSKVCTVRGLRDRRVRLSVPTAIQLYDLQDRLGLNQPSKVVDWLLNAAQNEIDELPPLQIPPGIFGQYHHQPLAVSHEDNGLQSSLASLTDANLGLAKDGQSDSLLSSKGGIKITDNETRENQATGLKPAYWNLNAPSRSKGEEVGGQNMSEKGSWMRRNDQDEENQGGVEVHNSACLSSQSSLSRPNISNSSFQGLLSNVMPFNLYNHWDPSNLSLSQFGGHGYSIQTEDPHNFNVVSMQPPLSLPLLCPSGTTPSFFSPYVTTQLEPNTRQLNSHLQMLNSSSSSQNPIPSSLITTSPYPIGQSMRPLQLSIASRILPSQDNNNSQSDKGGSGPF